MFPKVFVNQNNCRLLECAYIDIFVKKRKCGENGPVSF